jgi:hypothetical protein
VTLQSSAELRVTYEEETLVPWLRHYGALIALFVVVGIAAGWMYAALGRDIESTTLVVDREESVPAREFGVVGKAVFQSDAALWPAMHELGISTSTERFMRESVQLRPVPDARILLVVGRASTTARAREISSTMADALVAALTDAGLEGLAVMRGGVTGRALAPRVVAALGGFSGLCLGIGAAIALYHFHRPVLSLNTALHLLNPGRVTSLEGRASWLGALRPLPWPLKGARNDLALARLATQEQGVVVVTPGSDTRRRRIVIRRLLDELHARGVPADASHDVPSHRHADGALGTWTLDGERRPLVVTDPKTRTRELALEALGWKGESVLLLWIR